MKDYSRKIAQRLWNQPEKGELESRREETYMDDIIQKAHVERRLLEIAQDGDTVFDGGAGCGRFSIPLAKMGCRVTHFDISEPMLDKARALAEKAGVAHRITFVQGALEDLDAYGDRSFDLVLSVDAPISYTYPRQEKVIGNLVRMAKRRVLLGVSSRLGSLPYLANPIQKNQFILDESCDDPFVQWIVQNRDRLIDGFRFPGDEARRVMREGLLGGQAEMAAYDRGEAPWCITYTFLPDELRGVLTRLGVQNVRMAGPGAYARTLPREILGRIMQDPKQKADFLDFCYSFDANPFVCGLGKDNLLADGEIA